jgi:hypothetical protein
VPDLSEAPILNAAVSFPPLMRAILADSTGALFSSCTDPRIFAAVGVWAFTKQEIAVDRPKSKNFMFFGLLGTIS